MHLRRRTTADSLPSLFLLLLAVGCDRPEPESDDRGFDSPPGGVVTPPPDPIVQPPLLPETQPDPGASPAVEAAVGGGTVSGGRIVRSGRPAGNLPIGGGSGAGITASNTAGGTQGVAVLPRVASTITSTVQFGSNPPGATITLIGENGEFHKGVAPELLTVPVGKYTWVVELAGYLTDSSGTRPITVAPNDPEQLSVTLMRADDRGGSISRADEAFTAGNCPEAIRLYESVQRPANVQGSLGTDWVRSRMNLGLCYQREREFEKANAAFAIVASSRAGQWSAIFERGRTACLLGDFDDGMAIFRDLGGSGLGRIDFALKPGVRLLARYGSSVCLVQRLERLGDNERNRDVKESALSQLDAFLSGATAYLGETDIPPAMRAELVRSVQEARRHRASLAS